jgi:RimJ/RimL family protein N-acetyltransferase
MSQADISGVLRAMRAADIPAVLEVEEAGAVRGLADVFPQDAYPFPRDVVARRWEAELTTSGIECLVVEQAGAVVGFASTRGDEFFHFGIAVPLWGSGLAQVAHDEVLDRMRAGGVQRAWLRVFARNGRGRRFYEKLDWRPTGERSNSTFPPYAELLHYERAVD